MTRLNVGEMLVVCLLGYGDRASLRLVPLPVVEVQEVASAKTPQRAFDLSVTQAGTAASDSIRATAVVVPWRK